MFSGNDGGKLIMRGKGRPCFISDAKIWRPETNTMKIRAGGTDLLGLSSKKKRRPETGFEKIGDRGRTIEGPDRPKHFSKHILGEKTRKGESQNVATSSSRRARLSLGKAIEGEDFHWGRSNQKEGWLSRRLNQEKALKIYRKNKKKENIEIDQEIGGKHIFRLKPTGKDLLMESNKGTG